MHFVEYSSKRGRNWVEGKDTEGTTPSISRKTETIRFLRETEKELCFMLQKREVNESRVGERGRTRIE